MSPALPRLHPRFPRRLLGLVAALACSTACSGGGGGGGGGNVGPPPPPPPAPVTRVQRDAFGVPHVFANSDEEAYLGLGFACAEDRFFQMSYLRLLAQGRASEVFGRDPGDGSNVYLNHDLEMRLFGYRRMAGRIAAGMDPAVLALLTSYADGVNRYVFPPPGDPAPVLHPLFATYGLPVEPWTAEDSIVLWIRFARFFTPGVFGEAKVLHDYQALEPVVGHAAAIDALFPDRVHDEEAAVVQESDVPQSVRDAMTDYAMQMGVGPLPAPGAAFLDESLHFSHAWAVAGSGTTTGEACLFGDPRLPVRVPNTLWEAHMVGSTFDVRGVTVPGCANFLVGSNGDVAWSVTAMGMDQMDLFRVKVPVPGSYELDGQVVPFVVDEVETIPIKNEAPAAVRYRETRFGPLLTRTAGDQRFIGDTQPGEDYALRWIPFHQPDRDPSEGFVAMYRSRTAGEFGTALGGWGYPSANCVFADTQGDIGYWAIGALPLRSLSSPLGGSGAQDGATVRSDWIDIVPHDLKPWVINPAARFLYTANHLPVGEWYPIPFVGKGGHTARSSRLKERLDFLLPDPQSAPVDPDLFADIHADSGYPMARDLTELGVHLRDNQPVIGAALETDALRAIAFLEDWADSNQDGFGTPDTLNDGILSISAPSQSALARWVGRTPFRGPLQNGLVDGAITAQYGGGESGILYFLREKVAGVRAATPVDLTASEADVINLLLADSWGRMLEVESSPTLWDDWFIDVHLTKDLKLWFEQGGLPSLQPGVTIPVGPVTAALSDTILSQFQQSYSQFVVLRAGDPDTARSLAPIGQSEQATGPHFDDQLAGWLLAPQDFKPSPMTEDAIQALVGPVSERVLD